MASVLAREIQTYQQNRDRLLTSAEGKYVLIKADRVLGVYDSEQEAIRQGYRQLGAAPFLVRQIVQAEPDDNFDWDAEIQRLFDELDGAWRRLADL